ncbi:MAG: GntR family transcriptional regulator [bacterium]
MPLKRNHEKSALQAESADGASLEARAYGALRDILIQGGFPPGEKLSIRRIAAALGVSPMPARAALRRLAAERCLDLSPSGSAFVPLITRDAYREIMRIRTLIEPVAAADAAPRLTKADIAALEQIAETARLARAAGDEDGYRRGDRLLHQRYYAAANQPLLLAMIESLWMRRSAVLAMARPIMPARPDADDHQGLLAAAKAGDGQAAAEAVRREIEASAAFVLARVHFPEDTTPPAAGWKKLKRIAL